MNLVLGLELCTLDPRPGYIPVCFDERKYHAQGREFAAQSAASDATAEASKR